VVASAVQVLVATDVAARGLDVVTLAQVHSHQHLPRTAPS
jgi:superfamily II DNA/RNA helicase